MLSFSSILPAAASLRSSTNGSDDMDKDRIAGSAKEAKGAIKETAGKALGDAKLTAKGKSDKAEGKIQNAIGGVKDALKK
jgi:uncharacterized protein YjbJ (UPF0337 family)